MKLALKEIRKAKRLTQRAIAERLDVSEAQVSRWESGKDNIPGGRLPDVARAYECTIGEMFGEVPHVTPPARVSDGIPPEVVESVLRWVYERLDLPAQEASLLARASVVVMQQTAPSEAGLTDPTLIQARVETAFGMLRATRQ